MKRLIAASFFLALATPALAEPVALPVNLRDGATWIIEATRTETTRYDSGPPREQVRRYRHQARYTADTSGRSIRLNELTDSGALAAPGVGNPLVIEVDESLLPLRMRDWPKLRDAMSRVIDAETGDDRDAREAVKAIFVNISAEVAPQTYAMQMAYSALGQGTAMELGKPIAYDSQIPSALGGPPISAKDQFVLESLDPATQRAVIIWTQSMDPEAVKSSAVASLRAMGRAVDSPELLARLAIKIDKRCRFEIDRSTGLAVRTECARVNTTLATGEVRSRDAWIITQTLPEYR